MENESCVRSCVLGRHNFSCLSVLGFSYVVSGFLELIWREGTGGKGKSCALVFLMLSKLHAHDS